MIEYRIGDCLDILQVQVQDNIQYDAVVMDPPYEIGLHKKTWDSTGISFSPLLWEMLYRVLKPGAFLASFAASRLYHRLACVAEDAGFIIYPMLTWKFDGGLPKPANLSELFDRDNIPDRKLIGETKGSGYTSANVSQGAQQRTKTTFARYERYVSDEAKQWKGFYYGVNCFRPCMEPILLVQKPIATKRMIDNVREYGTGALNLNGLEWPSTMLVHKKAKRIEHGSDHPSVKPLSLMLDLCRIVCPPGGIILDPFAGTGTTGVAAMALSMRGFLVEQNPAMEPVIQKRLQGASPPVGLVVAGTPTTDHRPHGPVVGVAEASLASDDPKTTPTLLSYVLGQDDTSPTNPDREAD